MAKHIIVTVPADPDQDDCLASAEASYIEDHPELEGWDLDPQWTDEDTRETIDLSVPEWSNTEAMGPEFVDDDDETMGPDAIGELGLD